MDEVSIEEPKTFKPVVEVRGPLHGKWKIFYSDEAQIPAPVKVFDREGNYTHTIWVQGGTPGKMVEAHSDFDTKKEAIAHAESFEGHELKVTHYNKATQARLEKAAETRKKKRKDDD